MGLLGLLSTDPRVFPLWNERWVGLGEVDMSEWAGVGSIGMMELPEA